MALLGDQRKIDANKDGEITAKDFEMLREQRQSGGLLDDDTMRMGYADGNMVGPEEREVDFGMRDDYVNREILTGIVSESKMIGKYKDKEKYSNPEKLEAHLNKYIDGVEKNTQYAGTLNRGAMMDEFMKELKLYGVGREEMAEGGEMRMPSEDYLSYLIELDKKELKNVYQEVMKDRTDRLSDRLDNQTLGQILGGGMNLSERIISGLGGSGFDKIPVFKGTSEEKAFIEAAKKELNKREQMAEGGEMDALLVIAEPQEEESEMLPDEEMEQNFIDFVVGEALSPEEESMLNEQLEANPELSMLFDKVVEKASEFTGAGPVDGPGTGTSDDIPARLSDGEFVFTAKAVEQIGADNLMQMMKDAEAAYDAGGEREAMQDGGEMQIDEDDKKVEVEYSVTRPMAGEQSLLGQVQEEDETSMEIKKSMMSPFGHVRS